MKTKVTRKSFLTFFWILFFGILIIVLYSSCSYSEQQRESRDNSKQEYMFKIIYTNNMLNYRIVYDVETNVEYMVSDGQNNRGTFTMRVDSTGKPILYKH